VATREDAIRALSARTGLTEEEAGPLLDGVLDAAQAEAVDLIAGEEPVPSALTDAKALRLRYIASSLGRPLKQREVQAIFRLGPAAARTIVARMNATYATLAEGLLKRAVKDQLDATDKAGNPLHYTLEGSADEGWLYRISFEERPEVEMVSTLLARHGYGRGVHRETSRAIVIDKDIDGTDSITLLKQWLG
jgi:hypothetical protein